MDISHMYIFSLHYINVTLIAFPVSYEHLVLLANAEHHLLAASNKSKALSAAHIISFFQENHRVISFPLRSLLTINVDKLKSVLFSLAMKLPIWHKEITLGLSCTESNRRFYTLVIFGTVFLIAENAFLFNKKENLPPHKYTPNTTYLQTFILG